MPLINNGMLGKWGKRRGLAAGAGSTFSLNTLPGQALRLDFSQIGELFTDSARTTPVTADGDRIGCCDDISGNDRHFLQATAGKRLTYKTAIQNGLSVGRTDGTDDHLLYTTGIDLTTSATVLLVASKTGGTEDYLLGTDFVGSGPTIITNYGGVSFEFYNDADRYTLSAGATGVHVMGWTQVDATSLKTYFDSATPVTNTTPTVVMTGKKLTYLGIADGTNNPAASDFCELIVCIPALSDTNVSNAITALKTKWGIA